MKDTVPMSQQSRGQHQKKRSSPQSKCTHVGVFQYMNYVKIPSQNDWGWSENMKVHEKTKALRWHEEATQAAWAG